MRDTPNASLTRGSRNDLADGFDIAEDVVKKSRHYDEVLGGISRLTLQMNVTSLPHAKLMRAIELLGTAVAPEVRQKVAA